MRESAKTAQCWAWNRAPFSCLPVPWTSAILGLRGGCDEGNASGGKPSERGVSGWVAGKVLANPMTPPSFSKYPPSICYVPDAVTQVLRMQPLGKAEALLPLGSLQSRSGETDSEQLIKAEIPVMISAGRGMDGEIWGCTLEGSHLTGRAGELPWESAFGAGIGRVNRLTQ